MRLELAAVLLCLAAPALSVAQHAAEPEKVVVSTFNVTGATKVTVAVSSGAIGKTTAHLATADLERIRELVQTAYVSLEKLRSSAK
jgi:hypothetical protein